MSNQQDTQFPKFINRCRTVNFFRTGNWYKALSPFRAFDDCYHLRQRDGDAPIPDEVAKIRKSGVVCPALYGELRLPLSALVCLAASGTARTGAESAHPAA